MDRPRTSFNDACLTDKEAVIHLRIVVTGSNRRYGTLREPRVMDVVRFVHDKRPVAFDRLSGLSDWKGDLYATWRRPPDEADKGVLALAWEECGEPGDNVYHTVVSEDTKEAILGSFN